MWICDVLHHVLFTIQGSIHPTRTITNRFYTHCSTNNSFFDFHYHGTNSRSICGSKVLSLYGKIAVKCLALCFIEKNDLTFGEICSTLRKEWGEYVAEGF